MAGPDDRPRAGVNFSNVGFFRSIYHLKNLPDPLLPEIAFAGRSNVGKSSLINRLVKRRDLVKTSSRPGKTQCLNFFQVDQALYLVDLPGYGFARVSRDMRSSWQELITGYLANRPNLTCVVVLIDIRHALKDQDRSLVEWLRHNGLNFVVVYTKADKLTGNRRASNAAALDAALHLEPAGRILFSAKTGMGVAELKTVLASCLEK
ncbi:MAG TPA: YihA family ribosome biogenesis GTP-binding protein [Desulfobacteraceae bacterium]|nr:YihA family ribosome biogenesis GTP-binding protein [Desulfobacteraceae bacterium]